MCGNYPSVAHPSQRGPPGCRVLHGRFTAVSCQAALLCAMTVSMNFQTTDEQGWQNVFVIIISEDTHPTTTRVNVCMIRGRHAVIPAIGRVHYKWQKRLRQKSLADIVCHYLKLHETTKTGNRCFIGQCRRVALVRTARPPDPRIQRLWDHRFQLTPCPLGTVRLQPFAPS
jgi:hypothetical protein